MIAVRKLNPLERFYKWSRVPGLCQAFRGLAPLAGGCCENWSSWITAPLWRKAEPEFARLSSSPWQSWPH